MSEKKKKYPELIAGIETIGPKEANKYLEDNAFNRPFRVRHMMTLARQMSAGLWRNTVEPIILDWNGRLQDGQHRLKAVIHAEKNINFYVIKGADPEAFVVMDTGAKRSHNDALYIAGFPQPKAYGALADRLIRWDRMIYFGSPYAAMAPTNEEVVEFCEKHKKELAATVNFYMGLRSKVTKLMAGGIFQLCYHLTAQKNEHQAEDFFTKLVTGSNMNVAKYQSLSLLRNRLLINKHDEAKLPTRLVTLMVLVSWNSYRSGRKMVALPGLIDLKKAKGKKFEIF